MFESLTIVLAGICTLAIYSFLYRENPFYRIFEHLFIGIATAWGFVVTFKEYLWPKFLSSFFGFNEVALPDGTQIVGYNYNILWYLIPVIFSSFYYFIYSSKYRNLAQLVISFQFGCAGGLAFKGFFVEVLPQVYDCFRSILVASVDGSNGLEIHWSNTIFLITLFSSFTYFFFTFKVSESRAFSSSKTVGRLLMMVCFGGFFGSTMMARMALLVERLDFLANDWITAITQVGKNLV